jgi:hypothetical protein
MNRVEHFGRPCHRRVASWRADKDDRYMNLIRPWYPILILCCFWTATTCSRASSIGINFAGSSDLAVAPPFGFQQYDLAPTDVTGVVPQGHWNNLHFSPHSLNLVDDQGQVATFLSYVGSDLSSIVPPGTPAGNLLHSLIWGASITVHSPYPQYDLYLYFASYQSGGVSPKTVSYILPFNGGFNHTYYVDETGTTQFIEAGFVPGPGNTSGNTPGNYAVSRGQTSSDIMILPGGQLAGIQIVAVPEPSGAVGAMLGIASALSWAVSMFLIKSWRRRSSDLGQKRRF